MSAGLPPIQTAMVMAAGVGARMRPLTNDRPKGLIEVGGKALIDHMLDRLVDDGVTRAVVNVHHFADMLEAHVKARPRPAVVISDERDRALETGGGLVKARPLLGQDPIFVTNADSVWLEDRETTPALAAMRAAWDGDRMDALLLLARLDRSLGFPGSGDFRLAGDGRVVRPAKGERADYAYMGVQVFTPSLLDGRAVEVFSTMRIWEEAIAKGRLYGLPLAGDWMHVGDPAALEAAEAKLKAAR
jgi:MurNAc alpha-1-phosphate uridylyltransferase